MRPTVLFVAVAVLLLVCCSLQAAARPLSHHAARTPSTANTVIASPFTSSADAACDSCCSGGGCTYTAPSTVEGQAARIHRVQCCGVVANVPQCCAAPSGSDMFSVQKCSAAADESGAFTCENTVRSVRHMMSESAYLSVAGLVVIVVIGALLVCCYAGLAGRRTHARYYNQVHSRRDSNSSRQIPGRISS